MAAKYPSFNDREFDLLKKITDNTAAIASGGGGGGSPFTATTDGTVIAPGVLAGKFLRDDNTFQTIPGGGNALTSDPLSQFATTTSAQLRGIMSDPTGTGSLVFSASPALTGTPTAPTAVAGTNTTQLATTAFVKTAVANSSYIDGEVATYADLPITLGTPPLDSAYLVRTSSGVWLLNRKPGGIYIRTANAGSLTDWTYAGEFSDIFNDANFAIYDNADTSKQLAFQVSGISTGTTRTLSVQDANGTIALVNGNLGTPTAVVLTNATGLPVSTGVTGLGTGVATALGTNVGTAGSPVVNGGALGTPASGIATNLTGTAAGLTAGNVTTNANLTGDVTSVGNATTLATVNGSPGTFGSATKTVAATVNAKGLITALSEQVVTPDLANITGLGTGVQTARGVAVGSAGSPVVNGGALGTPSSGTATNLTGTAAGLTAGNVTTNANLTGDVTSVGNATTLATVNSNVGTFGSATAAPSVTVNAKGLVTAASSVTITPAIGSVTGLGTGIATALAVNVGTAGAPVIEGGALGTPSSGTLTSCTGLPTAGLVDGAVTPTKMSTAAKTSVIGIVIDGGGVAITTGVKGDIKVPFGCTITGAQLLADQSGSIVVDVWKDTLANYPPTGADSITASAKPTLSSATNSNDTTLTGWTTTVTAGDCIRFNVDSATTVTRVTLELTVTRT